MTKYAELPTGEILQFPDNIDDRDMRRAVRRKMGLDAHDLADSYDKLSDKMEKIVETSVALREKQEKAISDLSDILEANQSRLGGELGDGIRNLIKATEGMSENVRKSMGGLNDLVIQMNLGMHGLNRTLDAAMGESLATLDQGTKAHGETAQNMARSIQELGGMVNRLAQTVEEMSRLKKTKRKAYRARDGSYIFENDE